ncbi:MAG: hypothetical protein ACLSIL_14575 [Enterococcus casseliflavus]
MEIELDVTELKIGEGEHTIQGNNNYCVLNNRRKRRVLITGFRISRRADLFLYQNFRRNYLGREEI